MNNGKRVLGKELILSKKYIQALLVNQFGEKLLVQDVWQDEEGNVHMKVGKIFGVNSDQTSYATLIQNGFKEVTDVSKYPAKEVLDERIEQLIQAQNIVQKEW